jgi:hypothetical protein
VQDLHRRRREAHLDRLTNQRVRHAVVVPLDLDVVVDVHARLLPLGEGVGRRGQRQQRRPLHLLEELSTIALHLLEGAAIELLEEPGDLLVQLVQAGEGVIPQRG